MCILWIYIYIHKNTYFSFNTNFIESLPFINTAVTISTFFIYYIRVSCNYFRCFSTLRDMNYFRKLWFQNHHIPLMLSNIITIKAATLNVKHVFMNYHHHQKQHTQRFRPSGLFRSNYNLNVS